MMERSQLKIVIFLKYDAIRLRGVEGQIYHTIVKRNAGQSRQVLSENSKGKVVLIKIPSAFAYISILKVPLSDLLNFLSHELDNCNIPANKTDLITLIKLCTLDNKFKFEN